MGKAKAPEKTQQKEAVSCEWCGWTTAFDKSLGCVACYNRRHGTAPPPPVRWFAWGRIDGEWTRLGPAGNLKDAQRMGRIVDADQVKFLPEGERA
jgi:hypothetical protein